MNCNAPSPPRAGRRRRPAVRKSAPQKDYASLFYALLLRKRQQLGVSPMPTGPASELPPYAHADYEEAIREAGREVGRLYCRTANCRKRGPISA